jgi:hypothetical protein
LLYYLTTTKVQILMQRLEEQAMLKRERAHVSARDALKRAIVCGAGQPPCRGALLLPEPEVRRGSIAEELGAEATVTSNKQKKLTSNKKRRGCGRIGGLEAEATVACSRCKRTYADVC